MVLKDPDYKMQLLIYEFLICLLGINNTLDCVCTRERGILLPFDECCRYRMSYN